MKARPVHLAGSGRVAPSVIRCCRPPLPAALVSRANTDFIVRDANGSGADKVLQLVPILGKTFRISSMDNFLRAVGT
jgi:hypothetical protein